MEPAENEKLAAETEQPETVPQAEAKQEQTEQKSGENKEGSFAADLLDLLESVIVSVFVVMLIFTFLVCTADVDGDSMKPTLEDGDRLLVSRIDRSYETGDILILDADKAYLYDDEMHVTEQNGLGKRIVKRLIAQGGQEVDIHFDEGVVYVDGQPLDEPYVSSLTNYSTGSFEFPLKVPEGYIFVLGDNRYISKDSRSDEIGFVPENQIIGRVFLRLSPLSSFGKVS